LQKHTNILSHSINNSHEIWKGIELVITGDLVEKEKTRCFFFFLKEFYSYVITFNRLWAMVGRCRSLFFFFFSICMKKERDEGAIYVIDNELFLTSVLLFPWPYKSLQPSIILSFSSVRRASLLVLSAITNTINIIIVHLVGLSLSFSSLSFFSLLSLPSSSRLVWLYNSEIS
jgi:hypothetical protein